MAGIIKREFHVFAAESFVDEINTDNTEENNLFLAIGKTATWTSEPTPDTITTSADDVTTFWTNVKALVRIGASNVSMVVPRKDWASGNTYVVFNTSATSTVAFNSDFYMITDDNNIYECTVAGAGTSTIKPTATTGIQATGDGYSWRYMYSLTTDDIEKFHTTNWMPVQFEDSYVSGDPTNNHLVLGAKYAMTYAEVSIAGIIPTDFSYRQVAILRNPLLNDNADDNLKTQAGAGEHILFTNLTGGTEPTSVVRNTGEVMYIENRFPIYRDASQSEFIKLILEF